MKTSMIFKAAKEQLQKPEASRFICHAIESLEIPTVYKNNAINSIMSRLRNTKGNHYFSTLESWLMYIGNVDYKTITKSRMKAYRQRWLSALIVEFETKGD